MTGRRVRYPFMDGTIELAPGAEPLPVRWPRRLDTPNTPTGDPA